jgi:hypothetical protein
MFPKAVLLVSLLAVILLPAPLHAQQRQGRRGARGLFGDWDLKVNYGERQMDAILSFSRDDQGNLTADWIGFGGVNPLKDVKFEDGKLSFVQTVQFRDQEYTSNFTGTIEDGTLKGVLSGERGDSEVTGKRSPRTSRMAGTWQLKYKIGDRDITSDLVVKAGNEGDLTADWKNDQVTSEISDIDYQQGTLTFKRKAKMGDREWQSTFEGSVDRESGLLKGTMKSEMGDVPIGGKRMGEALIGTWNLDVTTDRGTRKQRMRVNPDMSALYGTLPIEKIELKGDTVIFTAERQFGERSFEMNFSGKLAGEKLTGEITTSRGSQKVEGEKVVRRFRRRQGN